MSRALLILLAVLLLDRGLGWGLARLYEKTRTGEGGGLLNYAIAKPTEILVLGSSRAKHQIDPSVLERELGMTGFNAGINGQDFLYAALLLELRRQASTPTPKLLILQVDPSSFSRKRGELDRLAVFSPYVPSNALVREVVMLRSAFEPLKYWSSAYQYNGKVFSILRNASRSPSATFNGFAPLQGTLPPAPEPNEGRRPSDDSWEIWPLKETLFRRLAAECRRTGSRLYLVHTPNTENRSEAHERWVQALTQRLLLPGVVFFDLSQYAHPEFRDRSLFRDEDHLNGRGAQQLSELLAAELHKSLATEADQR